MSLLANKKYNSVLASILLITLFVSICGPVAAAFDDNEKVEKPEGKEKIEGYLPGIEYVEWTIKPEYDEVEKTPFNDNLYAAKRGSVFDLVNKNGEVKTYERYGAADSYTFSGRDDSLVFITQTGKMVYDLMDRNGNILTKDLMIVSAREFVIQGKSYYLVKGINILFDLLNDYYYIFDGNGNKVFQYHFEEVFDLNDDGFAIAKVDGKYVWINVLKKTVSEPIQFDSDVLPSYFGILSDGLIAFSTDPLHKSGIGFMDYSGKVKITPSVNLRYSENKKDNRINVAFSEGLCRIRKNNKYGFIDMKGNIVIPFQFDYVRDFEDGYSVVLVNGKYGAIDKSGKYIISPEYEDLYYVKNGIFRAEKSSFRVGADYINIKNGMKIHIDNGRFLEVPGAYEQFAYFPFEADTVSPRDKNFNLKGYIDKDGNIVIEPGFDRAAPFKTGMEYAIVQQQGSNGPKGGIIDKTGKLVLPYRSYGLEDIYKIKDGTIIAVAYKKVRPGITSSAYNNGIIDIKGNVVLDFVYDEIGTFKDDMARFVVINHDTGDAKYGFLNAKGKVIIPAQYEELRDFSEGLSLFRKGDKVGYIDINGKVVIDAVFDIPEDWRNRSIDKDCFDVYDFSNGHAFVYYNGKWGMIENPLNVPTSYFKEEINKAKINNLVTQSVLNNYRQKITRKEFCYLAVKLYEALSGKKASYTSTNIFKDTNDINVHMAYELGIISGDGKGYFRPDGNITREQMAVMLYNTIKAADSSKIDGKYDINFIDKDSVERWAYEAVGFLYNKGIIAGVGGNRVDAKANITREQAIVLVERTFERFK